MKIKIDENILKVDIPGLLKDLLIEKYNSIKNKEKPFKIEIKFLAISLNNSSKYSGISISLILILFSLPSVKI